jgi:hypothetical protein
VQLPQDPTEDLTVVAPWLATPAVGGQERLHAGEGLVGELEHAPSPGSWTQERDAIQPQAISSKRRLECQ